jgi:hypothetical protein
VFEIAIEELAPFPHHELPGLIVSQLARELTFRVAVDDQEPPVRRFATLASALQLAGVESPVAAATHNHDVAKSDLIG